MKKTRIFYRLIALLLLLSLLAGSVWAEPEMPADESGTSASDEAAETVAPDETDALPEGEAEEPVGTVYRDYTALLTAGEYEADCKAALLIERGTGVVIYEKAPDEQIYPASLTKIMTCLVAVELCEEQGRSLDEQVTVTESAFEGLSDAGSSAGIQAGDRLTILELLYCMMLESANEACNILAEELAGNTDRFVDRMNERAHSLGCTGTHFSNAHGLHDADHYSTARDLARITEAALACDAYPALFPDGVIYTICTADSYAVTSEQYSGTRTLTTTNYLIRQSYPEYYYSRARGVKTGYTSAAGRCLISLAENKNLSLLGIVLGVEDDDYAADGLRYRSFVEMKELFEYGFDNFEYVQVLSELDFMPEVVVTNAQGRGTVVLRPAQSVNCLLMQGYDKEVEVTWALDDGATRLDAPLKADERVGTVTVSYNGVVIATTDLLTYTAVERQTDVAGAVDDALDFLGRFWWVIPALIGLVVLLFLVLILRNAIIRRRRRAAKLRRRQRERQRQARREQQR